MLLFPVSLEQTAGFQTVFLYLSPPPLPIGMLMRHLGVYCLYIKPEVNSTGVEKG